MKPAAFFVDAGYLFAEGSALLAGKKQSRTKTDIAIGPFQKRLWDSAQTLGGPQILRTYWYDAARPGELSAQQRAVAQARDMKLRLGRFNNVGRQKGVDSLLVIDLIELARNQVLGDAILLAGDDDLTIGVTIAQSFGVRVHLLGIAPSHRNQSSELRMEADRCLEWGSTEVESFLSIATDIAPVPEPKPSARLNSSEFKRLAISALASLGTAEFQRLATEAQDPQAGFPHDLDHLLLTSVHRLVSRDLDSVERTIFRQSVRAILRE